MRDNFLFAPEARVHTCSVPGVELCYSDTGVRCYRSGGAVSTCKELSLSSRQGGETRRVQPEAWRARAERTAAASGVRPLALRRRPDERGRFYAAEVILWVFA